MAKSIKEIWNGIDWYTTWQYCGWSGKKIPDTDKHYAPIANVRDLYQAADTFGSEVKRLRKVLIENGLAHYDSDGRFVEDFESETPKFINN